MAQIGLATILVVSFLCLTSVKTATGVQIVIDPNNPTETLDNSVHFTCVLGKDVAKYKEIYVMDIVKDNKKQIAVLRSSGITFKYDDVEKRFEAQGVLNDDVSQTYLNLTLLLPRVEDSGYYACVISYLDADGILQQDKDSARLVVKKIDSSKEDYLKTIVNSLVRRVEELEVFAKQNKADDKELQDGLKKQVDIMTRIDALEKKTNYVSIFSATIKEKNARTTLSPNKVIIFDDVLHGHGEGYDKDSGVFTAQKKGVYSFHLVLGIWSSSQSFTDVDLMVNGSAKARLETTNHNPTNDGGYQDQTEISLVVVLNAGDEVKAVASSDTTNGEQMIADMCMFTGYLVRLID